MKQSSKLDIRPVIRLVIRPFSGVKKLMGESFNIFLDKSSSVNVCFLWGDLKHEKNL